MRAFGAMRNDSSTAFFSHSFTCHPPPRFSATRAAPRSSIPTAALDRVADVGDALRGVSAARSS